MSIDEPVGVPKRQLADVLRQIAADQRARGFVGRSAAEIEADLAEDVERDAKLDAARRRNSIVQRLAFDLDETLGVPLIDGGNFVGWQMRPGCAELLDRLRPRFTLLLWSVSPRRYVDKALAAGLGRWFAESHSWDEVPARWKDVRHLRADWLVDDSPHHREAAEPFGLAASYVVVPAYGSLEDVADPLAWVRLVEAAVLQRA